MEITLTQGAVAVIDDADIALVLPYKWHLVRRCRNLYAATHDPADHKKRILMHRLIMNAPPDKDIDHRDCDGLNNRRSNLRFASPSQNAQNNRRRVNNRSGFKGVNFQSQRNKWQARITVAGKTRSLGLYDTAESAARAYGRAATLLFGEFKNEAA